MKNNKTSKKNEVATVATSNPMDRLAANMVLPHSPEALTEGTEHISPVIATGEGIQPISSQRVKIGEYEADAPSQTIIVETGQVIDISSLSKMFGVGAKETVIFDGSPTEYIKKWLADNGKSELINLSTNIYSAALMGQQSFKY